jgi:hypothetical protein
VRSFFSKDNKALTQHHTELSPSQAEAACYTSPFSPSKRAGHCGARVADRQVLLRGKGTDARGGDRKVARKRGEERGREGGREDQEVPETLTDTFFSFFSCDAFFFLKLQTLLSRQQAKQDHG